MTMIIIVCTHLTKCQSQFGYVVFVKALKITSTWMLVSMIVIFKKELFVIIEKISHEN
jgi:hypothetical protein